MPDWRDDLPPIPSDRMLENVKREGDRRLARQQQRRNRLYAIGGSLAAAAALIAVVASGVFVSDDGGDDDDAGPTVAGTAGSPLARHAVRPARFQTTTGSTGDRRGCGYDGGSPPPPEPPPRRRSPLDHDPVDAGDHALAPGDLGTTAGRGRRLWFHHPRGHVLSGRG